MKSYGYKLVALIALSAALFAFGCSKDSKSAASGGQESALNSCGEATWDSGIEKMMQKHCTSCHATGKQRHTRLGATPGVDYNNYEVAVQGSQRGNKRIQEGTMPIARPLSEEDKKVFARWVELGTPENPESPKCKK